MCSILVKAAGSYSDPMRRSEMAAKDQERNRMIVDLPPDVQLAIRIKAVKSNTTTGDVVCEAVQQTFSKYIEEAREALAEQNHSSKPNTGRQKS